MLKVIGQPREILMKEEIQIVLFRTQLSFVSFMIWMVTGYPISHSAVIWRGQLYDSSESRGDFGVGTPVKNYGQREVLVYNRQVAPQEALGWIQEVGAIKYDYVGVLGWFAAWLFKPVRFLSKFFLRKTLQSKKVWCFEATAKLLLRSGIAKNIEAPTHGGHLMQVLGEPDYTGTAEDWVKRG